MCLSELEVILQNVMHVVDNPAVSTSTCTPDYLSSLVKPTDGALNDLNSAFIIYTNEPSQRAQLMHNAIKASYKLATYLMLAKFTSNTSKDISFGDSMCYIISVSLKLPLFLHIIFN